MTSINKLLEKYGLFDRSDYGIGMEEIEWLENLSEEFNIPYEKLEEEFMAGFSMIDETIIGSLAKGFTKGIKHSVKMPVQMTKAAVKGGYRGAKAAGKGISKGSAKSIARKGRATKIGFGVGKWSGYTLMGAAVSKKLGGYYKSIDKAATQARAKCKGDADCLKEVSIMIIDKKIALLQKMKGEAESPKIKEDIDKAIDALKTKRAKINN